MVDGHTSGPAGMVATTTRHLPSAGLFGEPGFWTERAG